MHHFLINFLQHHSILGYVVVFIAMIFEGDVFLFTAAFLTHLGFFDPVNMFVAVVTGALSGDLFWYWLGLRLNGSTGFTRWAKKIAAPFDDHLLQRPWHTIFLSKFIYGIHHAILVRAGMLKFKLSRYFKIDLISTLAWTTIVGGLGFLSSLSFERMRHQIKFMEGLLLAVILILLLVSYLVSYQAKKEL